MLTEAQFFERVRAMPIEKRMPYMRSQAARVTLQIIRSRTSTRNIEQRRRYADDPFAYIRDVFGYRLSPQQEEALALMHGEDRVLLPAANNIGKTFVCTLYGIFRFDAVAALPDAELGLEEQGARILITGPGHDQIVGVFWGEMMKHADRAEQRGFKMPGTRSAISVLWRVRPLWDVQAFSPPRSVDESVAHAASGRHHPNQIMFFEEGAGVDPAVWRAGEGMCSASGNKIVSPFNPTESKGPAFNRARDGTYKVLHLSAFDHPNVKERRKAISGAIGWDNIDNRVKRECQDRGPYPGTVVDVEMREFVYALPPPTSEERGAREDGFLGHPDGTLRVYRPGPTFQAQVLGQWPNNLNAGLFSPAAWDAAVRRWKEREPPMEYPDRVGVDAAREGGDETCAFPAWGETASALLNAYAEAQTDEPFDEDGRIIKPVDRLMASRRAYIGECRVMPRGDGPTVAQALALSFPRSPFVIDVGGVGASVYDHMLRVIGFDATAISFSSAPPDPTPGEEWSENMRTAMYVRAARLVNLGLVDVPDDPMLREEVMAHEVFQKSRTVDVGGGKERVPSVQLISKDQGTDCVRRRLNPQRSPDRADAFVLALTETSDFFDPHIF